MKRVVAILLCLCMVVGITACKPDDITYPTVITDPDQQQTPQQPEESAPSEQPDGQQPQESEPQEEPADDQPDQKADDQDTPQPEEPVETKKEPDQEEPQDQEQPEVAPALNPLAADGFTPATGVTNTLTQNGLVIADPTAKPLAGRTITIYTADDTPAFYYTDEKGKTRSEWDWWIQLAEQEGFVLKYSIKDAAVSLKAQRTALYAGQKLSLIQLTADQLGEGMTLAQSAGDRINLDFAGLGVSKAVLEQSARKLFAPVGNVNALWYNNALMPENADPATLSTNREWTVEQFKTVQSQAKEGIMPFYMSETLAWATLSGKSPLTLADGKLDSNINAIATRAVWTLLREANRELPVFTPAENTEYSLKAGTLAMAYTAVPDAVSEMKLQYAPLPATKADKDGTVTYTGTFMALPKYEADEAALSAALTFAELWCNRYTEVLAGKLKALGVVGAAYEAYTAMAENQGHLILHQPAIEAAVETYLKGLTDPLIDMDDAYSAVRNRITNIITTQNLYY